MNESSASPRDLMRLLASNSLQSVAELARAMGTTDSLVRAMLGDLARHGYLATLPLGCSADGCQGCSIASFCAKSTDDREVSVLYSLTAKGRDLIERSMPNPAG